MISGNKVFTFVILAFCCISLTTAISCYFCDSEKSCNSPKKVACTPQNANATRAYLDVHYKNVPMNTTSPYFECLSDKLEVSAYKYYYKSCIYNNIKACSLQVRDAYVGNHKRSCGQCSNKDYCNPAAKSVLSGTTLLATVVAVIVAKLLWLS